MKMENRVTTLGKIKIDGYRCERCGHEWAPRTRESNSEDPITCPGCKSAYWKTPRKKD